ncbi:MAG: ATP synthase F0 subunit B [Lawsonibacter sp.]|nr:ATP synthase F0 subunit B [Lawsonibacter sp.]
MPLNIDWQQILLHWMNLAILTGGLYFLLYSPVKKFMEKREEHYRQMDEEAQEKLRQAEQIKADYQSKLDGAEEEIHQARIKAQQDVQQSVQDQLAQAQAQADQIIAKAQDEAEDCRERIRRESQRELREMASKAARKLAYRRGADPFDQFLDLAEGGGADEER